MSIRRLVPVVVALLLLPGLFGRARGDSDVILRTAFEGPSALRDWKGVGPGVSLQTGYQGSQSLVVERPAAGGAGSTTVDLPLPVERMRGVRVRVRAMIRAEDVATPPQPWSGIKLMLVIKGPQGTQYPARDQLWGTFDWRAESFEAEVPPDATSADLILGLEATTGRVWFDDAGVMIDGRPYAGGPVTRGPAYNGHPGIPRFRGAMVDPNVGPDDLRVLGGEWHANLIRYQLFWVTPSGQFDGWRDSQAYDAWLEGRLKHLDMLLPYCQKYGIHVVVDLHSPPGGNIMLPGGAWPLFEQKVYQDKFLAVWDKIARRYKGQPMVWGYDLANEPIQGEVSPGLMDWHTLATRAARLVRRIDPAHAIIVEPGPGGSYDQLKYFPPLPVPGVVYSVHMYEPGAFTMQGLSSEQQTGVTYPGMIGGVPWDKARMAQSLATVAEYQRHYHVAIYIGEFSAIRWAPGAARYLSDAIDIFEHNGWDWSYHAFREWTGWSVEYPSDREATAPASAPTDRELLLRSWYQRNQISRTEK